MRSLNWVSTRPSCQCVSPFLWQTFTQKSNSYQVAVKDSTFSPLASRSSSSSVYLLRLNATRYQLLLLASDSLSDRNQWVN